MTDDVPILIERKGRVGLITLNRPEALNALNAQLMHALVTAAEELDSDDKTGAIIVTGSERAFAAGADIKEMADLDFRSAYVHDIFAAWDRFAALRTPTIAAVSGYALGGGCELAMMCDVIVASDTAVFGQPEIGLGVIPGIGGTQRLTRAIGSAKAMDMVLTGRQMKSDEAERAGLVSRVVPAADLMAEVMALATEIASRSLPVLYAAKEAVRVARETTLAEGVRFERRSFAAMFAFRDQTEGMTAFAEKRSPQFEHR